MTQTITTFLNKDELEAEIMSRMREIPNAPISLTCKSNRLAFTRRSRIAGQLLTFQCDCGQVITIPMP